jgi:hypothetical protein
MAIAIALVTTGASGARRVDARYADAASALADLKHIDRLLAKTIGEVEKGISVEHRLDQIRRDKLALIDSEFTQPVDGVKGSVWFRDLDCVDEAIPQARAVEAGHLHAGDKKLFVTSILQAAKGCKESLERAVTKANPTTAGQPTLKPIHAVFTPASAGQSCSPPSCTTVYTEDATGQGLTYSWSVSIPKDPDCARGFQPNKPNPDQATWYHADVSEGGYCNHTGQDYNASGSGHPGTVTVVVTNASWSCKATFDGTQGPQAQPSSDGPAPQQCKQKAGT